VAAQALLLVSAYVALVLLLRPLGERAPVWPWVEPLPFAILGAAAIVLDARWEEIPERFAVHFGLGGRPDGWAPRTVEGVFGPLVAGAAVALLVVLLRAAVARARSGRQALAMGAPERLYAGALLLAVESFVAVTFATTSFLALGATLRIVLTVAIGGVVLLLLGIAASLVLLSRRPPDPGGTPSGGWRAGGIVYADPSDADLWVPKRIGIGWTLNFSHPAAWWVFALLILAPFAILGAIFLLAPGR
jgi:uncharacterized membrane protein